MSLFLLRHLGWFRYLFIFAFLLLKILKHWVAKWCNLKRRFWLVKFSSDTLRHVMSVGQKFWEKTFETVFFQFPIIALENSNWMKNWYSENEKKLFYHSIIIQTSQAKGKFRKFFRREPVSQLRMHKTHIAEHSSQARTCGSCADESLGYFQELFLYISE